MSGKFRMGLVGCGDICGYVALGIKLNPRIEMAGCADPDEDALAAFAKKNRIKTACADYREMLEKIPDLDAVYLGVPHYLHYPMIRDLVERGIPVFCEKPVCTNLEDAMDLCSRSLDSGVKIGINYQYRYDRACYNLVRAVHRRDLGDVMYARCNLPWHRDEDYFSIGKWRVRRQTAGGGTLITQCSHLLDVLLLAMKHTRPVAAQAMMTNRRFKDVEVEDLCMGVLEMDDGSLISISSSMVVVPEQPVTIEVYGSKGTGIYTGPESPKVRFEGVKVKRERPPVFGLHALFRSLEGFRRWVLYDRPFLTPIEQSLPVLAAVLAIYRSADSGRKESVDQRYLDFLK